MLCGFLCVSGGVTFLPERASVLDSRLLNFPKAIWCERHSSFIDANQLQTNKERNSRSPRDTLKPEVIAKMIPNMLLHVTELKCSETFQENSSRPYFLMPP